ncbi:hypothetical protein [Leptospira sp. GIMC2001]|uniref:hypothetical protein n=1 Tax=Leptospira sp. GIMC2001 TaxID=1513297 RepID=UPI00234AC51E|nr:hypothetical protein [Leptospira sp. GIMC2001]WCL48210.1 hypothetical protein O4O04_12935 [Leptospira sp. GIMC2001]
MKLSITQFLGAILISSQLMSVEVAPTMKNISRFEDDRIAFHYIHNIDSEGKRLNGSDPKLDPSLASLVVIKDSQTYIFRDGYDDRMDVNRKINAYQKLVAEYRTRRAWLKEFRDIEQEKSKLASQPEEFRKGSNQTDRQFHSLFMKYDNVYRTLDLERKKANANEYRANKFSGSESPDHIKAKKASESIELEIKDRIDFLTQALSTEATKDKSEEADNKNSDSIPKSDSEKNTNPSKVDNGSSAGKPAESESKVSDGNATNRSRTPVPEVQNPGEWNEKNFYDNNIDGILDYFSYSRSARNIDLEKRDIGEEKAVSSRYTEIYKTLVDRLLDAHLRKFKYNYTRKNETGSRILKEDNPSGKGKRITLLAGDNTRYVFEDWDGDDKVESFEVSNQSYPFRWASDSANIISIRNCKTESICKQFENIIRESESGIWANLEDVKNYSQGKGIIGSEDELIRDFDQLIKGK